jgi:UDP-N-acetylenolpyruvoylglucosamine reductase
MSGNWGKASFRHDGRKSGGATGLRSIEVSFHTKLRDYTTIGIGGAADRVVFPRSPSEVREILAAERRSGRTVSTVGAGSNLLVADAGVAGTVLCTKKHLAKVVFLGGCSVIAEAGVMLPRLAVLCALSGLSGIEALSGIPGTVGGALTMNAGSYGRRIGELTDWVEIADTEGEIHRIEPRDIRFGYREAVFPVRGIVVRAGLRFSEGSRESVFERMREWNEKRRAEQPWGEKTFGSTFRNPPGRESAGVLLERAGMKGVLEGDACFSEKHANFIVNRGRATSAEVRRLMVRGQEAVVEQAGVLLAPEVRMWGEIDA